MKRIITFILFFAFANFLFAETKKETKNIKPINIINEELELKREKEKLEQLKKDIDARIEKNIQILSKIESLIKELQDIKSERIDNIVKIYEVMPSKDAAQKLSNMNEDLAVRILLKMNNKKAGNILSEMETKKAVSLTEKLGLTVKNFPVQ